MSEGHRLLVHSARQLVQVTATGEKLLTGARSMNSLAVLERRPDGQGVSVVVDRQGLIEAIGFDADIKAAYHSAMFDEVIDATDKCIIPGLVDAHTHAVWAGDRVHEFAMKLSGATYLDIHRAGGGIHFTVRHVHAASEHQLSADFMHHVHRMTLAGTTLFECKTGYGLTAEAELKMLRVIDKSRDHIVPDVSVTYCAAHAVPEGSTAEEAINDIINVQLPDIRRRVDSGQLHVDNVDVFCEQGVFDVDQARRILTAGQAAGLAANFHGEELHCLHSAEMGAEIGARAISHLEEVSDAGLKAMADAGTIAVLLPTTAYMLRLKAPPARQMIDAGVTVALGSDFNPNAHCLAMPIVMHLACILLHLSMPEALVAATLNAAASLGKSATHGSLEVGKLADMVVIDAPRWEHLIYQFGSYQHTISHVIKNGCIVHCKTTQPPQH